MGHIAKVLVAITPLLLTVLFGYLVTEGHLNLGGGEKDVFLVLPPLLWSLAFLVCFLVLWWRRASTARAAALSAAVATGFVVLAWTVLLAYLFLATK